MNHKIQLGDCLELIKQVEPQSIDCLITSPPYWAKRRYNEDGELGLEQTPEEYISNLADYFDTFKPYLKEDANVFVNIGDTYFGSGAGATTNYKMDENNNPVFKNPRKEKYFTPTRLQHLKENGKVYQNKQLLMIPARFAIEMQNRGWIVREDIIWHKPNRIPNPVRDRTNNTYEHILHFVQNKKYYYDLNSIKVLGKDGKMKNPGDVWSINTQPLKGPHTATFPEALVERLIKCGSPLDGVVFDPFLGAGTTWIVSEKLHRNCIGFEINPEFLSFAIDRYNRETG